MTCHIQNYYQTKDAFAVNTAFQRGLAKAISYHGLGHYIYAGEDLPQSDGEPRQSEVKEKPKSTPTKQEKAPEPPSEEPLGYMINSGAYKPEDREPRAVYDWDSWADVACAWVDAIKTMDTLKKFYNANKQLFELAKEQNSTAHQSVADKIKSKKEELSKEKK